MAWLSTDYVTNTLDYIDATLNSIKSALSTTKEVLSTIGNIIGTIVEILGFIGFRVFILLITTAFVLWLLNLVSPISKKTNYILAVGLVLWIAITAKMPIQIVVLKYVLIIVSPFIITFIANFLVKNLGYLSKICLNSLEIFFRKVKFKIINKKINKINEGENIGIIFTSDLPTIEEINKLKVFIETLKYKPVIFESEKISLVDNQNKIVFSNDLKVSQLLKSIKSKEIKLLWFWSELYGANEIINELLKENRIKQNKMIVGSGDNSFILNFLQEKWNWKVIYGKNLKYFFDKNIFENKIENLLLINDYNIENNYFLKEKIVGSDLSVLVDSISTNCFIKFKNKILFIDCKYNDKFIFYRALNHLKNYIVDNNIYPKAIIFGNIFLKDNSSPFEIIKDFNSYLKNSNINIPFFQIQNFEYIFLNLTSIIKYKENKITFFC